MLARQGGQTKMLARQDGQTKMLASKVVRLRC